jgi:hypothetical protein
MGHKCNNPPVLTGPPQICVTPRVHLPNVGENVQEHIFAVLAFGTRFLLGLSPSLTT